MRTCDKTQMKTSYGCDGNYSHFYVVRQGEHLYPIENKNYITDKVRYVSNGKPLERLLSKPDALKLILQHQNIKGPDTHQGRQWWYTEFPRLSEIYDITEPFGPIGGKYGYFNLYNPTKYAQILDGTKEVDNDHSYERPESILDFLLFLFKTEENLCYFLGLLKYRLISNQQIKTILLFDVKDDVMHMFSRFLTELCGKDNMCRPVAFFGRQKVNKVVKHHRRFRDVKLFNIIDADYFPNTPTFYDFRELTRKASVCTMVLIGTNLKFKLDKQDTKCFYIHNHRRFDDDVYRNFLKGSHCDKTLINFMLYLKYYLKDNSKHNYYYNNIITSDFDKIKGLSYKERQYIYNLTSSSIGKKTYERMSNNKINQECQKNLEKHFPIYKI